MPLTITEPSKEIPVMGEYEVVVLGGGPAGIMAGAAAARCGRSTIVIERYGFLGGAGTAAGLSTFCGLHANVYGEHKQVVHGLTDEILERIRSLDGLATPHLTLGGRIMAQAYDISAYKIAADEMLVEASAKVLFHAMVAGVIMDGERKIRAVVIESKSGRAAVLGQVFIDCTGDADVAAWAGVPYEKSPKLHGMLYPSTCFRINGVDVDAAGAAWEVVPKLMEAAEREEGRTFPRKGVILRPQKNPIEWRANMTQIKNPDGSAVDGTDVEELSYGEIEGRRQIKDMFAFIRSRAPGFEHAYIVDIATQIGIRETRRIVGEYQLSEHDIVNCADFPDAIGVNGWPVEAHVAGRVDVRWQAPGSRGFNQLPFRMIVPQKVDNLYVAGRCASMTHDGQSSARVTGPCFVMGQAAGTAADLALRTGTTCRDVDVLQLQERLRADGVYFG
ncbi:MAG: FAD-dependent oxidoreductase [Alicyclobacillaceae bacterium]|nr:FAD-dependent oxidoreductase [Alicyclobacillaceae bacterium]